MRTDHRTAHSVPYIYTQVITEVGCLAIDLGLCSITRLKTAGSDLLKHLKMIEGSRFNGVQTEHFSDVHRKKVTEQFVHRFILQQKQLKALMFATRRSFGLSGSLRAKNS